MYMEIIFFFADLIRQYLQKGDIIGFINAVFTLTIGEFWYVFPLMFIFIPLYIKTGSLEYVVVLWILIGGILTAMLPAPAMQITAILTVLGIAFILYRLVRRYA